MHADWGIKFLESQHSESLIGGTFKFGRLRYYRLLEMATENSWIGDANEGRAIARIPFANIDADTDEATRKLYRSLGFNVAPTTTLTLMDTVVIRDVDAFVFSFSRGPLLDLTNAMTTNRGGTKGYNTAVCIEGIQRIAERIYSEGTFGPGRFVRDHFRSFEVGPVRYEPNSSDIPANAIIEASPFLKLPRYHEQFEHRIVLYPKDPIEADSYLISIPVTRPIGIVCVEPTNAAQTDPTDIPSLPLEDRRRSLLEIRVRIGERQGLPTRDQIEQYRRSDKQEIIEHYWALRQLGYSSRTLEDLLLPPGEVGGTLIGVYHTLLDYVRALPAS